MQKIITIDENTRIKIIAQDYMLQYKTESRNKRIAWKTNGHFPDLISLSEDYLNNAPYRAIQATEDFKKLIEVIKIAKTNFCKAIEKNNQ